MTSTISWGCEPILVDCSRLWHLPLAEICNRLNLLFSYLCVKSKLEELRGYKAVPVMSSLTFYLCLVCIECELDCTYHVVKSNSELLTNAALIIESEVFWLNFDVFWISLYSVFVSLDKDLIMDCVVLVCKAHNREGWILSIVCFALGLCT